MQVNYDALENANITSDAQANAVNLPHFKLI